MATRLMHHATPIPAKPGFGWRSWHKARFFPVFDSEVAQTRGAVLGRSTNRTSPSAPREEIAPGAQVQKSRPTKTPPPKTSTKKSRLTIERILPWLLLIGGAIAVLASAILTNEYINIIKNPHYRPVCNLNPIFSCSSVTTSRQAHAFGPPNEFIGLAGYAVVATIGGAILAGAKFKRWFWLALNGGLLLTILFLTWLQFQTLYRIGALCLFCMVVWAVSIPIFWYVSLYNLKTGDVKTPKKLERLKAFALRHHGDILLSWYLLLIILILKRFWYYWSTLF